MLIFEVLDFAMILAFCLGMLMIVIECVATMVDHFSTSRLSQKDFARMIKENEPGDP